MELEIVPQRVYNYGDGVPAYKSGEWPGIRSSKFNGSKLILRPNRYKIIKENYFPGTKKFPPRKSEEYKYICGKKLVPPFVHDDSFRPQKDQLIPFIQKTLFTLETLALDLRIKLELIIMLLYLSLKDITHLLKVLNLNLMLKI